MKTTDPALVVPPRVGSTHLAFAVGFLALYPVDVFILGRADLRTLVLRCAWSTLLLLYGLRAHRVPPAWHRRWSLANGLIDTLFFLGLIRLTGGSSSPYFNLLPATPILLAQTYPTYPLTTVICGVTGGVGAAALLTSAGRPWGDSLFWCFMIVAAAAFGVHGVIQSRRAIAAEERARAEQARREVIEQLAMKEYTRAHSDKLATLGRLAANVLHELNNPLAYVRSNLEFLRKELGARHLEEAEELLEALEDTRTGVERIQQIASDLRSFSRMDQEGPDRCSLQEVIPGTLRIASLRLKHVEKVRVEVPERLPLVYARPQRLTQVLLNLLVNAGDALESRQEGGEVQLVAAQEQDRIILLVEDNGPGIPPHVLPRLFEPFFTTKGPELGTGLGLALSREMMERFNGSLTAENRPEGGARMRLTLRVWSSSDKSAAGAEGSGSSNPSAAAM